VIEGMGCASIGTDTGGSIRIPSAACGCVGLKPTYGELPCDGIVPLSVSLDHVGPLARSVTDAWIMLHALRGAATIPPLATADCPPARRLRIGILRPYFMDALDAGVRALVEATLARLGGAGARLHERSVPHAADIVTVYLHLQLPEASAYHARALDRQPDAFTPPVRLRLEMGRYVLAEDYVRARRGAEVLRAEVDRALEGCDALALPTLPIPAPLVGAVSVELDGGTYPVRAMMLRLTQLFDITGHPAISLPCGHTSDDLPVGFQLVGRLGRTDDLLRIARSVEGLLDQRA
jgi:aspartyl-tRNA(Asn)/glutamyl-tRNA(Gln) amidotransferase subunit A